MVFLIIPQLTGQIIILHIRKNILNVIVYTEYKEVKSLNEGHDHNYLVYYRYKKKHNTI